MELKGASIIITGGSSGLGKAMAKLLVNEGASVLITGRDKCKLENVANEIGCSFIHADVSIPKEAIATIQKVLTDFGKLDVLINNAGFGSRASLLELDLDKMKEIYNTNVFGATTMAKYAAEVFVKQNKGNIINIASTAALKGYPTGSMYASSKFALRGLTQCWQAELRKYNVRVVLINPSEVPTAFGQENREERLQEDNKLSPKEIAETVKFVLEMDDRGYIPEVTVHATNPF